MIAILMSTYNGEKYIQEQIESLLQQTVTDWQLFVRDDGSKDQTVNIIGEYVRKYPQKIFLSTDAKGNLGAGSSFMYLLENVSADYYMFCDQDDVWLPQKISQTLVKLKELERNYGSNTGIGVFSDLTVVDAELNVLEPSLWKADNRHPEYTKSFYKQWTNRHATYGCTQMINEAAKQIVLPYKQFEGVMGAHDNWIEYILIKKGIYDYIEESTILYRQHGANVIGGNFGYNYRTEAKSMVKKPYELFQKLKKDYKRSKQMPFYVSFTVILIYRLYQTIFSIFKN